MWCCRIFSKLDVSILFVSFCRANMMCFISTLRLNIQFKLLLNSIWYIFSSTPASFAQLLCLQILNISSLNIVPDCWSVRVEWTGLDRRGMQFALAHICTHHIKNTCGMSHIQNIVGCDSQYVHDSFTFLSLNYTFLLLHSLSILSINIQLLFTFLLSYNYFQFFLYQLPVKQTQTLDQVL